MTNVQPMTKSLLSQSGIQSSSCEAEKEQNRSLERQNLVCELEHASCEKMRALGVELLKQSVPVIEALEERFAGLANGLFLLNKVYTTLYSAPSSITIDLTSGRTDIYKAWRERNLSGTYHFRGIHDERPVYKVYFYYKHKIIMLKLCDGIQRDEKIEDGRDAYLYFVDESGWLLTHGADFEAKNKASWFIGKTTGMENRIFKPNKTIPKLTCLRA